MTAENILNPATPYTIVLIHGLWMTPLSWEHWIDHYEARGFRVLAPAWPGMDGDIDELRRDPSGIEHLGSQEIVDHYDATIRELDLPPIIMGHSRDQPNTTCDDHRRLGEGKRVNAAGGAEVRLDKKLNNR